MNENLKLKSSEFQSIRPKINTNGIIDLLQHPEKFGTYMESRESLSIENLIQQLNSQLDPALQE